MNRTTQIYLMLLSTWLTIGVLLPSTAYAHVALVDSSPAADAIVTTPDYVSLVFNEPLVARASRLRLHAVTGDDDTSEPHQMDNKVHIELEIIDQGKTLRATPHHPLDAGVYHVEWRAVGSDNHPMTGQFHFTVQ